MKISNFKLKIFLLFTIYYLLFTIGDAKAQELGVSTDPPIIQIDAKAPAIINSPIIIHNLSDQSITYNIFLTPFKPSGSKSGEVEFDKSLLPNYQNLFKTVQLSEGNRVITQVKLGPSQSKELNLRITLAKGEPPKDYYFSVLFISQETADSKESFTGARAGITTNVLLSLGPKSKTQGYIKDFSSPLFVTKGPVEFNLNIVNTSTHYVSIKGNIVIKNIFGQTVGNIDLLPVNILAESDRISPSPSWNEKFLLGIYKADLTVALSEEGPILNKSLTFFAFPIEAVLGIIVAIVLVVGIARRAKRKQEE